MLAECGCLVGHGGDNAAPVKVLGVSAMDLVWVTLGGALGSAARFVASGYVAHRLAGPLARMSGHWLGEVFPWGTLAVNIAGSAVIGVLAALTAPDGRWLASPATRQFLMLGVLGGFTTFSSFSLQTLELLRDGEWFMACANVLLSVGLCLAGVWLGFALASWINR
jgi:CrcB protein